MRRQTLERDFTAQYSSHEVNAVENVDTREIENQHIITRGDFVFGITVDNNFNEYVQMYDYLKHNKTHV